MASSMLGVDLTIDDFPTLLNYLDQLIQKAPAAQKAMRKAFRGVTPSVTVAPGQTANANTPTGSLRIVVVLQGNTGLSTRGGRSQQTSPTARRQSSRAPGVYGAAQRHRDLQRDLHDPAVVADRARFQDTLRAFRSNEKRLNGTTLGDKLTTLVRSTRINAGSASPLIGRSLDAIEATGPEGVAIAAVATAAIAAAAALYEVAKSSAEVGNSFSSLQVATGSNVATTSQLTRLGAGLGLSPEQTASMAQTLQERITSDPIGRATGLRLGVFNLPGPYGNQDYGAQLEVVLKNLQKEPFEQRIRDSRTLGIGNAGGLTATGGTANALDITASTRSAVMTQEFQQDSRNFSDALQNISDAFSNFLTAIGPTVLPEITDFLNNLADAINAFAQLALAHQDDLKNVTSTLYNGGKAMLAASPLGPLAGLSDQILGTHFLSSNDAVDAQTAATERNTAATERNTAATMNSRYAVPGVYGTFGDRGTGLPSGVNGQSISRATLDLPLF